MKRVVVVVAVLSLLILCVRHPVTHAKGKDAGEPQGRELSGRVVDPNGHPVARARLRLRKGSGITEGEADGKGCFSMAGLGAGPYEVDIEPPERARRTGVDGTRLHEVCPPVSIEVRLPWVPMDSRPGALRISVAIPRGGPDVQAWLILDPPRPFDHCAPRKSRFTAAQEGLPVGTYRVLVRAGEWVAMQDVQVHGGSTEHVSMTLHRGACARIHVRDGKEGPPLPTASAAPQVEAIDGTWVALPVEKADSNGDLSLRGLPDRGGIEVSAPGHVTRILLRVEDSMEVALDREP